MSISPTLSILPATHLDIPQLARISSQSFETDRHTLLKEQGSEPYDHEKDSLVRLPTYITSKKCVLLKAVDGLTGEILGFAAWGFRGLEEGEVPFNDVSGEEKGDKVEKVEVVREEAKAQNPEDAETPSEKDPQNLEVEEKDPLKRLNTLTSQNLDQWMETLMPPGTRCMFMVSMSISPAHQGKGVGSELLKWGTSLADQKDIFIWVHSSEGAVGAYKKSGFEVVGKLDVDLDAYAPGPPPKEVGGEKWGHYVFSYMKYIPEKA